MNIEKVAEFCVRLHDLAKECNVQVKLDSNEDLVLLPTYTKEGYLDKWFVVYVNPWHAYFHDFTMSSMKSKTQETQ